MIKIILGLAGSGKTLTAVRSIVSCEEAVFCNFDVKAANAHRLKIENIIKFSEDKKKVVNWDFWREQIRQKKGFHIYLDELHNIMHSRMSMSKMNVALSTWVAQIRKVTGANELFDFVCISQELARIDIAVRDLANEIVYVQKRLHPTLTIPTTVRESGRKTTKPIPLIYVFHTYFKGSRVQDRYDTWRMTGRKTYNHRAWFVGNPFLQYFDSYSLVDFGETAYL